MKKSLILCLGLLLSLSLTSCEEGSHQGFVHVDETDDTTSVEPLPDEDDSDTGSTPEGGESGESGDSGDAGESGGTETPHTHTADTEWHYDESDPSLGHWHVCVDDGEKMDETVASHTYVDTTVEATHTEDGSITHTCECGYSYVETIPAIGHNYTSVDTEPTCTEDGYTTYTCDCGESYTVTSEGSALGHQATTWTYVDETSHKGTCTRCSEEITEEHTITSKEDESYYYTYCSVCDPNCEHPISTVDKSVEHTHTESSSWTTDGEYHWKVCTECGQTIESTKAAHALTYTSQDAENHTVACSVCGYSTAESHTLVYTPISGNSEQHQVTCSACEYSATENHTLTYVSDGESTHHAYCATCAYTGESVTHNLTYTSTDSGHTATCQDCSFTSGEVAHTLVYTYSDETTHTVTCSQEGCSYSKSENHTIVTGEDENYTYTYCSVCNHLFSQEAKVTEVFESFTYHITINDNSGNSLGYAEGITLFAAGSYNGTWTETADGNWYSWGDEAELVWNSDLGTYDLVLDFIPENTSSNLSEARYFYVYYSLTESIVWSDNYRIGYYQIGTNENDPNAVGAIEKTISISTTLSSWDDLTSVQGSDTPTDFYVVIFDDGTFGKDALASGYTTLSGGTYNYFDGSDSTSFTLGETSYSSQPYVVSGKGTAEAGYKTGFWFTAHDGSWGDATKLSLEYYMNYMIPDTSDGTVAVFCLVKGSEWNQNSATTNVTGISNGWVTDVPDIETFFSSYITGWVN